MADDATLDAVAEDTAETPTAAPIDPTVPITLSHDAETKLSALLLALYTRTEGELRDLRKRVKELRDLYEGNVDVEPLMKNGSKVYVPFARLITDVAASRGHQTLFSQRDVAVIDAPMQESDYRDRHSASLAEDMNALHRWINHLALEDLNFKTTVMALLIELKQVGTVPVRTSRALEVARKKVITADPESASGIHIETRDDAVLRDEIMNEVIPMEKCGWDTSATDGRPRFIYHTFTLSGPEVEHLAARQRWPAAALKRVLDNPSSTMFAAEDDERTREGVAPAQPTPPDRNTPIALFALTEWHLRDTDIDGDGALEDSVVTWHLASGTVTRAIYRQFLHGDSDIEVIADTRRRQRLIGVGVIEPVRTVLAGINAVVNQTIDAATVRNNPGIIFPEESTELAARLLAGYETGMALPEPPGAKIRPFEFPASANTVAGLSLADRLADIVFRVSYLGPAQWGDVSAAQRVPSDVGTQIMRESTSPLDARMNLLRISLSRILRKCLAISEQVHPARMDAVLGEADAMKVRRLYASAGGVNKLRVSIHMTSATHSRELTHQNFAAFGQFLFGYLAQAAQLVGALQGGADPRTGQPTGVPTEVREAALESLRVAQNYMNRFAESSADINDASAFVPDLLSVFEKAEAARSTAAASAQAASATFPGVPPASAGPGATVLPQ